MTCSPGGRRFSRAPRIRAAIATLFLALIAFCTFLVWVLVNIGQVAAVRTEVSNAADAGALAGASWMTSGQTECLWITRKMWDSIAMAQALFLIPFCPDAAGYGTGIRTLLGGTGGLLSYFGQTCDGVMKEAWKLGCQGMFTASFNNMIVRNMAPGAVSVTAGPGPGLDDLQLALYTDPQSFPYGDPATGQGGLVVEWLSPNSSHSFGSSASRHVSHYVMTYPGAPPTLTTTTLDVPIYTWLAQTPFYDHFNCGYGWGITSGGSTSGVPAVLWTENPLEVVPGTGIKRYDFALTDIIPDASALPTGPCASFVCGITSDTTTLSEVPDSISGGSGTIGMAIAHQVFRVGGAHNGEEKFRWTAASANAAYGPSPSVTGPWTWPQDINVVLTGTQ